MSDLDSYLQQNRDRFESDLCEFLRIPSVSADSRHQGDMQRASEWVNRQFVTLGFESEIVETSGHPLIYAESPVVEGAPTVLVYGHYDVQPPDPLDQWITPPFQPTVRDGNVYARGATDDKGQMLTHVKSAQAWIETRGSLPVRLKFLIEGDEEIGSGSIKEFLEDNEERLASDIAVVSDTCQFGRGKPAITYGLRGIVYFELNLTGPKQDLHSGTFGGCASNPANTIATIMAALTNENGKIQVPNFYDDVIPLAEHERAQFAGLPFDEAAFMQRLGVDGLKGENGYSTLERRWARPTFDVNGIWGGYQGEGAKTVIPSTSGAKFSFRLVPNQDPARIQQDVKSMIEQLCPPGISMDLISHHCAPGIVVAFDSPYITAATQAIELGFGRPPVFIREGGSIPIVNMFLEKLAIDTLLLGWGLDDDNTHSPNEKFSLADYHRGIKSSAYLWQEISKLGSDA